MKVKKYLPSLITLSNLFLGFLSILYIQRGDFSLGCNLILIAAILDSLDGKLARKIGIASDFGKEIDSLADLISFCLAPSVLIFNIFYSEGISELLFLYLAIISAFPVLMGAIRLARFNIGHTQESKQNYFIGLPSPMSAITICSIVLLKLKLDPTSNSNEFIFNPKEFNIFDLNIIVPTIILLSFLMIGKIHFSKFPLFSLNHSKTPANLLFLHFLTMVFFLQIFLYLDSLLVNNK